MKSLEGIRQRCRNANDRSWYDRQYWLQVAQSGYTDYLDTGAGALLRGAGTGLGVGRADLTDYPIIDPGESIRGVANHMLVNARISVASIVLTLPQIHLRIDDQTEKELGEAWFEDSWINGNWSEDVKMAGMDVEANALGWMVCGPSAGPSSDQTVIWQHVDVLDMLFDRGYKSPGLWRWINWRERVPLDDAVERFGHIFNQDFASGGPAERAKLEEDHQILDPLKHLAADHELTDEEIYEKIKSLCVQRVDPINSTWLERVTSKGGTITSDSNINDHVLHVWHYWDGDNHVAFLASIDGKNSVPLAYRQMAGPDSAWNYQIATEAGPNAYDRIPGAWWLGNWASGMYRPTPKAETVKPLADMIKYLELLMVKAIKQSLPMIIVDSQGDVEFRAQWAKAIQTADPMAFIEKAFGGDLKTFVQRLDVGSFDPHWIEMRALLKQELDAATGVSSPYRGQAFGGGEKTRKEATDLVNMGSTQQREMRNQYAKFLEMMVSVSRTVGALIDTKPRILQLEDGPVKINKGGFPIAQFLSTRCHIWIDPNDMVWRSKEEVEAEAIAFLHEAEKGIEMGMLHPQRVWADFLAMFGRKKLKLMYTDKEFQANQQAKAQAAQQAAQAAVKEVVTASLKDMEAFPILVERWAVKVGLLKEGEKLEEVITKKDQLEADTKLKIHEQQVQHKSLMTAQEHAHRIIQAGMAGRQQLALAKAKPKPLAATNGKK